MPWLPCVGFSNSDSNRHNPGGSLLREYEHDGKGKYHIRRVEKPSPAHNSYPTDLITENSPIDVTIDRIARKQMEDASGIPPDAIRPSLVGKKLEQTGKRIRPYLKLIIPLILAGGLFAAGRFMDLNHHLHGIQKWIWQFGSWGPIVFVAIYVAAMLVLLPGTPFTILAAFLFGNLWGFLTMMAAGTLAAAVAFLMARYLARDTVARMLSDVQSLEKLKQLIEANNWFVIPFIRLMPIFPFAVNNYAFGLTDVSFMRYMVLSLVVFIPMNAAMVLGANSLYAALTGGEVSWPIMGGAAAAAVLILGIGYAGKRLFARASQGSHGVKP